ncbi:MAG TPA: hypothetical protein GX399_05480 [Xanthomonadaceae bacterium]|nr:hypothetical protein [Xanthomonadaceae bacterium]
MPDDPSPWSCHGGFCPQAIGHHDVADRHGPPPGSPDRPSQSLAVAGLLPPDWLNSVHSPPIRGAATTGPPPAQRSRVLRL